VHFGTLFTAVKIGAAMVFALEYAHGSGAWPATRRGNLSPLQDRIEYALSSLGIIDLLAFLPAAITLIAGQRSLLVLSGVLPFFKLVRYSPAMRSLLAAFMPSANPGRLPGDPDRRDAGLRLAALCHRA